MELIRKEMKNLIGKKIKVFFRYATVDYAIKKSGILLECDNKFFVLDEVQDGRSVYSYDFVISVLEDKP